MKTKRTKKTSTRGARKSARPTTKARKRVSARKRTVPQAARAKPPLTRTAVAGHGGAAGLFEDDAESTEHFHTDIGGEGGD